jgi:CDP-diacylglycerol---glycerol-3-phosphate 3-phosphatidyltransferase
MGLYAIKPWFQRRLSRLADVLVRWHVHPDALTYGGVLAAVAGGAALLAGVYWVVPLAAAARLALNALDGMVALRGGLARPWGQVLNEVCDRLADLAFLSPLAYVPGVAVPLAIAALLATQIVSYLGVLAAAVGGRREYGGVMGKADRMLWLSLASTVAAATGDPTALQLLPAALLVGAVITLVQRGVRIHAAV